MKTYRILNLLLLVLLLMVLVMVSPAQSAPAAPNVLTGYYNMMGFEGVSTWGTHLGANGPRPPVNDYGTTHCQYINVPLTTVGDYYMRFALKLPNGANINKVSMRIADYYSGGSMWVYLRSRPWNSRDFGDTLGFALTPVGGSGADQVIHMENLDIDVNNATTQYWIDMSPQNSANPGQLCVYSLQVQYTTDGTMLPLVTLGN